MFCENATRAGSEEGRLFSQANINPHLQHFTFLWKLLPKLNSHRELEVNCVMLAVREVSFTHKLEAMGYYETQHNVLTAIHNGLTTQHNALRAIHNGLTTKHNALTTRHNELKLWGCNRNHNPKALEHPTGLPNPQPSHKPLAPSPPQAPVTLKPDGSVERKLFWGG